MQNKQKRRKSVALTKSEQKELKSFVAGYITLAEASEVIGINDATLSRTLIVGRASPETISAIREKLNTAA